MKTTTLRAGALAAGLTLAAGLHACGGDPESRAPLARTPAAVTVSDAWSADAARSYPGRIESGRQADVATRASGVLRSIPVDVGDRVRAGQVVAVLDGEDVSARIRAAEAQLALAEQTHGRVSRLATQGAASQQELDQAVATLEAARAAVAEAEAQAGYVEVTAPFAGVVVARMADPGDLAVPGRPVLRIQGEGEVRVVADLPADATDRVAVGTTLTVRGDGASVPATVVRVVPALDPGSRRFRVEARLEGEAPGPPGTVVTLTLAGAGQGSRWIPADAVVRRGQLAGAFTVELDTLRLRWLRLGRTVDGAVEVLAGPEGALTVVRRPGPELMDGTPVSGVTREEGR